MLFVNCKAEYTRGVVELEILVHEMSSGSQNRALKGQKRLRAERDGISVCPWVFSAKIPVGRKRSAFGANIKIIGVLPGYTTESHTSSWIGQAV